VWGVGNKNTVLVEGDDISGGIGYAGLNYLNRFNETTTFTADLRSDFGSLGFQVSNNLSLKIAHFTRSNSDLSQGDNPLESDSDSVTSFNLVFDI